MIIFVSLLVSYSFNALGSLVISAGGLPYVANRTYQFKIETLYLKSTYCGTLSVVVKSVAIVPLVSIG